jgi:DNA-directed RNA polymerase specialized sigma24 family protein
MRGTRPPYAVHATGVDVGTGDWSKPYPVAVPRARAIRWNSLDDPDDSQSLASRGLPGRMTPNALHRYRAERLLRKDFAGLRAKVLAVVRAQLRGKGVTLDTADLEACYAQAWHGLYATVLGGEAVENPSAWLVLVTFRRAIDESRAAGRIGIVEGEEIGSFPRNSDASAESLAGELDNRAQLRHVFEGLRATLSKRECEAASLCYLQGLTRAEAARRMGISEVRMRKLMEGAGPSRPGVAGKVGGLLDTIKAGGWCEQQGSLMRALAFGILDPEGERHALAMAHCRECPACRAHVASLRGLASVLPLPLLSPLALAGAGGAGAGSAATGPAARMGAGSTRIAASGLRAGSRASGGLVGLLIPKLAVIAVFAVGAGYAMLGSRAHGSPPAGHATRATPQSNPGGGLAQTLPPALAARPSRGNATRHFQTPSPRPPARGSRSVRARSPREFLPERLPREQGSSSTPAPASTRLPGGSRRAGGEFGIEK